MLVGAEKFAKAVEGKEMLLSYIFEMLMRGIIWRICRVGWDGVQEVQVKKIQVLEVSASPERRKKSAKSEPTEESLDIPSLRIMPKVLGHGAGSSGVAKRVF